MYLDEVSDSKARTSREFCLIPAILDSSSEEGFSRVIAGSKSLFAVRGRFSRLDDFHLSSYRPRADEPRCQCSAGVSHGSSRARPPVLMNEEMQER